jgi:xanthine dehydrogenase YagR molybdenum-binding subunit
MNRHLKMDEADTRRRLDDMAQGVLGTPLDRPDGPLKVAGTATYAAEWRHEDLCHGVLVRAPATKGRLRKMSVEAVEAMPGILTVVSDKRLLRNPAQGMANEAPVQGNEDISYFGQPVALVVAESFEEARHGAQALALDIDRNADFSVDPEAVEPETPEGKQSSMGDLDAAMRDAA